MSPSSHLFEHSNVWKLVCTSKCLFVLRLQLPSLSSGFHDQFNNLQGRSLPSLRPMRLSIPSKGILFFKRGLLFLSISSEVSYKAQLTSSDFLIITASLFHEWWRHQSSYWLQLTTVTLLQRLIVQFTIYFILFLSIYKSTQFFLSYCHFNQA